MRPETSVAIVRRAGPSRDERACQQALAVGSKSFAAAARLLPVRLRGPAAAVYAFCRVADDAIDGDHSDPWRALDRLRRMLDRAYAGRPLPRPIERALTSVIAEFTVPRAPFDALLDGFAWDASGREMVEESDMIGYSVRVASSVGVIMTLVMGHRDRERLARACDLGIAMQLTNIARDVGEDARRGRVYLPSTWLEEAGLSRAALLREPAFSPALGIVIARVLDEADVLYGRAGGGVEALPVDCRPAIRAARLIYADIGRVIRRRGYNTIDRRAHTDSLRKLWLVLRSRARLRDASATDLAVAPVSAAHFLVDAVEQS